MQNLRQTVYDGLNHEGVVNLDTKFAFPATASKSNDNTLTQSQMLQAKDMQEFLQAQIPEICNLEEFGVFEYHPIDSLPIGANFNHAVWSYRRKLRPDGTFLKSKARTCLDGSRQTYGVDYWETYAPVVQWAIVRLVLVLSHILGLKSKQIDFTQAFPQAELKEQIHMHIPQGWYYDASTQKLQQHLDPKARDTEHFID